ncbi:hypothetical protein [Pseudoduganella violaceinigra]|uniref:hypothetical protein n=1 Tax=Pseudoduganella violaceinigra TaxID=246602 RepID=UPI00041B6724|nr:hypothetical protein [Pseudoduganella violaceinigra]
MKSMIRVIVLWLMLVALPFQGFAAASMLLCGAAKPVAQAAGHDHAAMQASAQHDDGGAHCAGGSHGNAMGHCCVGAALAYALPQAAAQPQRAERLRLPEAMPPPPVDLALPKRPPRAILA